MNVELIRELIKLRYKLLWAKTRSRNGRIALFLSGYLLLICLLVLLMAGGFGAGYAAVKSGKSLMVARVVLTAIFAQATLAAVILGFGINTAFSETELRRYPLKLRDRWVARHLIGIVDPFWFLFLFLEIGLLFGLYIFGTMSAAAFWLGLVAVLLLFVSNYLLARVLALYVERLMKRRGGAAIVMLFVMALAFAPTILAQKLEHSKTAGSAILQMLSYTPPFGAAAAMAGIGSEVWQGMGLLILWLVGIAAALIALEKRPPVTRAVQSAKLSFDNPFDRWGALFGERDAPYVAHWLRFYVRNSRFRTMCLLSLMVGAFLTFSGGAGRQTGGNYFAAALGALPVVTFMGNSRMAVNQFGYVGGGFRRFFLLPTDPITTLRAGSYASMFLGALMIPVGLLAWAAAAPVAVGPRGILMLALSGVTGVFVFHGLGLWVTLFGPRKGNYYSTFGNDMSLMGNIVLIGGMMVSIFLPRYLARNAPTLVSPDNWWETIPAVVIAAAFYFISLRSAAALFPGRREQLLAVVEGRDS